MSRATGATLAIHPFVDEGLGNSAYLVETGDGRALALDPPRHVTPMREVASSLGVEIAWSVETHLHADFVSGSRELASAGATVVASRGGGLEFPHRPMDDRGELDLGGLTLEAMATPGHTPEHLGYLLRDGTRPLALFSGGALLPGAVARTDLIAADRTEALGRALYRALHERVLALPDELPVYPTHGTGSFCSTAGSDERTTTVGRERAANPLLAAPDEDAFLERLGSMFGSYPTYFGRLREVNRRGPRVLGGLPELTRLEPDAVDRLRASGAEIIDARPMRAYAAGHLPGSLSIALRPAFASWLGWLVAPERPLVFVLGHGQDRRDLVRQALGIGYERLEGELAGGVAAWRASGRPVATTRLAEPGEIEGPLVDVRQASEYRAEHIPGAIPLELGSLPAAADAVPDGATVVCAHGERAMTAASLLERAGRPSPVLLGGPRAWARATGGALERA